MFHFGEIEKGAEALAVVSAKCGGVVEEVEAEVDEAGGGGFAVDEDVSLR